MTTQARTLPREGELYLSESTGNVWQVLRVREAGDFDRVDVERIGYFAAATFFRMGRLNRPDVYHWLSSALDTCRRLAPGLCRTEQELARRADVAAALRAERKTIRSGRR